jgi:hypothetical protein
LVMTPMRLGLVRDLRKICQDFSRAMARSTGARAGDRARFSVRSVGGFAAWRAAVGGGDPVARSDVGHVGEDRDALARAGPEDLVGAGGRKVVGPARQGRRQPQDLAGRVGDDLHVQWSTRPGEFQEFRMRVKRLCRAG